MNRIVVISFHLAYWALFVFLLFVLFVLMTAANGGAGGEIRAMLLTWIRLMLFFAITPGIVGFYGAYFWLYPRFLRKKRLKAFFAWGITIILLTGLFGALISLILYPGIVMFNAGWSSAIPQFILMCFMGAVNLVIGLVIKGFITSYEDIRKQEELLRRNTETELALVKSQINPHFLFNTLNNIDVLILRDPVVASQYLNKLSDILRFMLYEAKTEKIPLSRELSYIHKYIDLQKIRTAIEDYVILEVHGEMEDVYTEPLLFLPFIENAFKHADTNKRKGAVNIRFDANPNELHFTCINSFSSRKPEMEVEEYSGLGNDLIRKRLQLLYGENHTLEITETDDVYTVQLTLKR
jgi:two-component system, LytTR family, sensor kinase